MSLDLMSTSPAMVSKDGDEPLILSTVANGHDLPEDGNHNLRAIANVELFAKETSIQFLPKHKVS
jgi:hypothetical protein